MKLYTKAISILLTCVCLALTAKANAKQENEIITEDFQQHQKQFFDLDLNRQLFISFYQHPILRKCLLSGCDLAPPRVPSPNPLTDYEAPFPHATQPVISPFEKGVLTAYLNNSSDLVLIKFLALYTLKKDRWENGIDSGQELRDVIIAEYFLNRAKDLGAQDKWISVAIRKLDERLARLNNKYPGVALEENHPAHLFFNNETFFTNEANRYLAQDKLLDDYVLHPNNAYTAFLNVAVNNWNAGEANYDDPTLLYNFLVSGYMCFRVMDLAQATELAWKQDPAHFQRFRLASIIGGFSGMQRRSMAKIHHDPAAMNAIDNEHREWRLINKAFHAFTIGLAFFEDEDKFLEAFNAWEEGFAEGARPELVTVHDYPRLTFNLEGMFVGRADFNLKLGDLPTAYTDLMVAQLFMPNSAYWDYGRDAIQHRQQYATEIAALYANDNPADDPAPFMVKRHQWGGPDSVCQVCHQRQSKVWTQAEIDNIPIAPDDILTVDNWPARQTTWYGALRSVTQ